MLTKAAAVMARPLGKAKRQIVGTMGAVVSEFCKTKVRLSGV